MRAILVVAFVGCTPDIASGSYACGPEQQCPEGQTCDGVDGTCVLPTGVRPFACEPSREHEPDNTAAQALQLPALACVSDLYLDDGCLAAGDDQDWVRFVVPANCLTAQVDARLGFPLAWEPVGLELWDLGSMTMVTSGAMCKRPPPPGDDSVCLTSVVSLGGSYGIKMRPAGGGDCGGTCNFNRYQLTVQLSTPQ